MGLEIFPDCMPAQPSFEDQELAHLITLLYVAVRSAGNLTPLYSRLYQLGADLLSCTVLQAMPARTHSKGLLAPWEVSRHEVALLHKQRAHLGVHRPVQHSGAKDGQQPDHQLHLLNLWHSAGACIALQVN
jgi:hypothetical protein